MSLFENIPVETATKTSKIVKKPVRYSDALADDMCRRVARGESLIKICESDPKKYPTSEEAYRWAYDYERRAYFAQAYTRAKQEQAHYLADEIMAIADDVSSDHYVDKRTGKVKTNNEAVARSRLKVDVRKWQAAKLSPNVYGDKTQVEHTGTVEHRQEVTLTDDMKAIMSRLGVAIQEDQEIIEGEYEEINE